MKDPTLLPQDAKTVQNTSNYRVDPQTYFEIFGRRGVIICICSLFLGSLLVLVFVFLFRNSCGNTVSSDFAKWNRYSLGNVYFGLNDRNRLWTRTLNEYPTSIAGEYIRRCNGQCIKNESILREIVESRQIYSLSKKGVAIVHLRCGDIVNEMDKNELKSYFERNMIVDIREARNIFVPGKRYYTKILNDLCFRNSTEINHHHSVSKFVIVGSDYHNLHKGPSARSLVYRDLVVRLIRNVCPSSQVHVRWNGLPDDDFLFMASAHTFVKSSGTFSESVATIVRSHPYNRVIE